MTARNKETVKFELDITVTVKGLNQYGDETGTGQFEYTIIRSGRKLSEILAKLEQATEDG